MVIAALVVAGGARRAAAEPNPFLPIVEALAGEERDVPPRLHLAARAGGATDLVGGGFAGELSAGTTWGRENTGLFGDLDLHRIAGSLRLSTDEVNTVAASLAYGYTSCGLGGYSIDAGLDARLSDGVAAGPMLRLTGRFGPLGLFVSSWWYGLHGEDDADSEFGLFGGASFDLAGMERFH